MAVGVPRQTLASAERVASVVVGAGALICRGSKRVYVDLSAEQQTLVKTLVLRALDSGLRLRAARRKREGKDGGENTRTQGFGHNPCRCMWRA